MTSSGRALAAASLASLLVLGASACSASGSSTGGAVSADKAAASPSPTALTADQLFNKSAAAVQAATSLRLKGSAKDDTDGAVTFDLALVRGKGCSGTMGVGKEGSFKMVLIGRKLWVMPDTAFWKSAGLPSSARAQFEDKYLATSLDSKAFGSFADFCDLSKIEQEFGAASGSGVSGAQRGAVTTIEGQRVVTLTDPTDGSHAYVTDGADPRMVRLEMTGSDAGFLDFLDYDKAVTLTEPAKAETIDGSKYGF